MPELLEDPRFKDLSDLSHKDELEAIVLPWLAERSKREAMEAAQKEGIPGGAIQTPKDMLDDPHFNERGFFVEIEHPVAGKFKYPGAPLRMDRTPWEIKRPAPLLGQHNEEVLSDRGYSKEEIVMLRQQGVI